MAQGDKNLPVKLVVVEATKIEGEHIEVGTVLNNVPTDLAFELGGSGKVRAWTKELEADMKARAKNEKAAAEARASNGMATATLEVSAGSGLSAEDVKAIIGAAVTEGIQKGMQAVAEQLAAAPEEVPGGDNAENTASSNKDK